MKNIKTLDEKHSEMVAQFSKNREEILPKLEEEIEILKSKLKSSPPGQYSKAKNKLDSF